MIRDRSTEVRNGELEKKITKREGSTPDKGKMQKEIINMLATKNTRQTFRWLRAANRSAFDKTEMNIDIPSGKHTTGEIWHDLKVRRFKPGTVEWVQ